MAEVKWIKITTDIFDDEKMALIDGMPERDGIIVIWFKLLCMAGRMNNGGVFMLNDKLAYTDEMLATIFRRPLNTVRMALNTFEQFGMVDIVNNAYTIPNWDKHQNLDKLEAAKEKTRQRVAAHREKQKLITQCNDYSNVTVTLRNATEEDKEEDNELDIDIDKKKEVSCQQIADLYNSICISFPSIRTLSDSRRKAIKARLNTYSLEDFKAVFENAEKSSFLKGSNDRNWTATFDWLIKDSNMAKVLEGNYEDKKASSRKEKVPGWAVRTEMSESEVEDIRRFLEKECTPEELKKIEEERKQLEKELQESFGRK